MDTAQTDKFNFSLSRRRMLALGSAGLVCAAFPLSSVAEAADADKAIKDLFGDGELQEGRVTVDLPPIAENGNSVAIKVTVDSPMTETDYVKRIAILSPRNPIAEVAEFQLGPRAGKAEVATRIRMAGTQTIRAVAEMSDGTLWIGKASTVVTLAACIIG
ncbi:SoxY-related AACIE arm protein [Henriciella sp. AS95]|uniref:SoxY-related AACIE arm protein n=1 Tax=Henriciella sp. AS95 TaxID=3135782 RepID=UPI0031795438